MAKNYNFTFFLPKLRMPSKLRQNAAVIFIINWQNNSNKCYFNNTYFLPEKKKKRKMLRF